MESRIKLYCSETLMKRISILLVFAIYVALPGFSQSPPKPVVMQHPYWMAPSDLATLWGDASVVARIRILSSETEGVGSDPRFLPLVRTRHHAQIQHVIKGAIRPGSTIDFLQTAGNLELGDKIIVVEGAEPLAIDKEYVVFLANREGTYFLSGEREGAFRVDKSMIVPMGNGRIAQQHRGSTLTAFLRSLEDLRPHD